MSITYISKRVSNIDQYIRKTVTNIEQCVHGGRVTEYLKQHRTELLDFSANFNPFDPPDKAGIEKIIIGALKNIEFYPDNRYIEFKNAAAGFAGVKPDNIIPANGSSEVIRLICETILSKDDVVLLPWPTFDEYELNIRLMDAVPQSINYRDMFRNPDIITDDLLGNSKALFICNPNNPTGTLIERSRLEKLAGRCQENKTFLVIDEAFIQLSDPAHSIADLVFENQFVIVIQSLTKVFAIPGLRIGYGITHEDLAARMNNIRIPWNLGKISEVVGIWLLDTYSTDTSYLERSRELIRVEREWLIKRLSLIRGFEPIPSDTCFILIKIRDFGMDSSEITQHMLEQGIIIRDCESFKGLGKDYIRVAVRKRDENQKLIDAFSRSIIQWGKKLADKEIEEAVHKGKIASRTNCEYYPCHFEGQDCTFCFCPFYPCGDERTGGEMVERSTGGTVWSCAGCDHIHNPEVANQILEALMASEGKPEDIKLIWKKVIEPLI
jgi:threonine-phosphate decarboxylase